MNLEFRRNYTKQTKLKKQGRSSEGNLLNIPYYSRNYSGFFSLQKENKEQSPKTIKKTQQPAFSRKNINTYSVDKQKRPTFGQRYPLKNIDKNNQVNEGRKKFTDKLIEKPVKKSFSLKKQEQSETQKQNQNKEVLYFIDCFAKKNKILNEAYLNIHLSLLTFKTFKRACMFARSKNIDNKVPKQTPGRKTIIFDMDETLIHTNQTITPGYQIKVPFRSINGRVLHGYVCVRPYAKQILKRLNEHFDIIVFTAGSQPYADPILDHIDPTGAIQHRLYRQSCTLIDNQVFVKDLRILNRSLQNIVLVDNAPHTYIMQLNNGIPIIPYYKGKQDKQLYRLQHYLMKLKDAVDVRRVNAEYFQLQEYVKYESRQKIVSALYHKYL